MVAAEPSLTGPSLVTELIVGLTLATVSAKVVVLLFPWLSVAVIVTVWLWLGPSVVPNDQLHVPSAFFVTVPTDADSVTVSSSFASDHVPVFAAVWPSLTATLALFRVRAGAA